MHSSGRNIRGSKTATYTGRRSGWAPARGGRQTTGGKACLFFQQRGGCKFGSACNFSHELPPIKLNEGPSRGHLVATEETTEQIQAREDYNSWKRLIKSQPRPNDMRTAEILWSGALEILNGGDREGKQKLPMDLDDQEYCGREHIKAVIAFRAQSGDCNAFVRTASVFLQTMSHPSLLDCLSVDTFVGGLYNFVGGTNGSRAVPMFQHLCEILVNEHADKNSSIAAATIQKTLIAMSTALRELVRREPRVRFNNDLPILTESMQNALQVIGSCSRTSEIVSNHISEICAVTARAKGLLVQEDECPNREPVTSHTSGYPLGLATPRERHDNDKMDVTEVKIFPTRGEILSDNVGFLPTTDLDQPHFITDKSQRHIDTHFRLLRHDTFGELKDALGSLINASEGNPACLNSPKVNLGDFRAHLYPNAIVSFVSFHNRRGLGVNISFPQPSYVRNKPGHERRKWWEDSRRLAEGVLLSFISAESGEVYHLFLTVNNRSTDAGSDHSLTKDDHRATITAKLTSHEQVDIETVVRLSSSKARGVLIEFPGVLPATFVPILENLQNMQRLGRLPFQNWILPDRDDCVRGVSMANIPPPLYARQPGFVFSLKSILKPNSSNGADILIDPSSMGDHEGNINQMETQTGLDHGQCRALFAALTREFALIQGPPGTGKSYLGIQLMRVLLDCKKLANLGPILVVCYTNHALDQFLEYLLSNGTTKIIRIGGQSHSIKLEGHNLRVVSQMETKSRSEKYLLAKSYENLDEGTEHIQRFLGRAHGILRQVRWKSMQYYLSRNYPQICRQFSQFDESGFQTVGRHPFEQWADDEALATELKSTDNMKLSTDLEYILQKAESDVHALSPQERAHLVNFWRQEIYNHAVDDLFEKIKDTDSAQQLIANVHDEVDRRVLQEADVIGITTTGLAKRISTLQRIRCKVIICEEAGEVMEPHMISALLPTVEHFIQIGDHEQLRPQINNYSLSMESKQGVLYQLDRSQFERLSVGVPGRPKIPVAQLNVQRRMRPAISTLIKQTIYPNIEDHPSTTDLPDVVGMRKNVFWLDHDHFEEGQQSEIHHKSHSNDWEAEIVHALVRHIVRQGEYRSSDIAVLTPYTGQLQTLRSAMRNDFEVVLSDRDQDALERDGFINGATDSSERSADGPSSHRKASLAKKKLTDLLRVATVDNFQGEEAKVVIVSLVRSNQERKVGFLRTTNRINVLLSRAQHGMYVIGNTDTYTQIQMWQTVIGLLRASDSVGKTLGLCCPRHKNIPIEVSEPDDFPRYSPEGGCNQACHWRLPDCGHMCMARCHSESMHNVFSCPQPCQRLHTPCGHACQKQTCGEDCGKCLVKLTNVELPCGHLKESVACHLAQNPEAIYCNILVPKEVQGCGHTVEVACSLSVTSASYKCPVSCTTPLLCGHTCPGTCGQCYNKPVAELFGPSHQTCRKVCGRRFGTCNHLCRKPCHEGQDCGLCVAPCEVRCPHSHCTLKCGEACAPCVQKCRWSCEHQGPCRMPCSAPCDRLPCDRRCSKSLSCGHQCPGICGETCAEEFCHDCKVKQAARVDLLEMKTYAEIDVDETPIVVLGCGHFFTAETLDGVIGMKAAYVPNQDGHFTELADISGTLATKIPQCPDCQRPVRQYVTQRYNRVINRAVIDELSKRFLVNGKNELRRLEIEHENLEEELVKSRKGFLAMLNLLTGRQNTQPKQVTDRIQTRLDGCNKVLTKISGFLRNVSDSHQPTHKLHEATIHALRSNQSEALDVTLAGLSLEPHSVPLVERDRRVTLAGQMAQIKLEFLILEDKFSILQTLTSSSTFTNFSQRPGGSPHLIVKPILELCAAFISKCITECLPKLAVEATIYHARMARLYQSSGLSADKDRERATVFVEDARTNLEKALQLCNQPFQNVDQLKKAVQECIKLLQREWYEAVSSEELAAIKEAMVSGPSAIATHSGHWYNCVSGHPFAIGECGMPMEEAHCPECGASIGGLNHRPVAGVTRAREMED